MTRRGEPAPSRTVDDEADAWMADGSCATHPIPDWWFPELGGGKRAWQVRHAARHAIAICQACGVQNQCAEYAIDHADLVGIWGGLLDDDRRAIRQASA